MEMRVVGERIESSAITLNTVSRNSHRAGEGFDKGVTFDCDLIGILSGGYVYCVDGREYAVGAGELFYVPAGCRFSGRAREDSVHYFCHFTAEGLNLSEAYVLRGGETAGIFLRSAAEQDAFLLKCALRMALYRMALESGRTGYEDIPPGIRRAVEYMDRNPRLCPAGTELAAIAGMNYSYFSRLFHRCMGLSPVAYRDRVRMEEAKRLLLRGANVKETAEALGFPDMFAFSKKFKRHFRITPSRFRGVDV